MNKFRENTRTPVAKNESSAKSLELRSLYLSSKNIGTPAFFWSSALNHLTVVLLTRVLQKHSGTITIVVEFCSHFTKVLRKY